MRTKRKSTAKARSKVKGGTSKDGPRKGSKLEKVGRLLSRSEGCTAAEVLKATGWPSVSMPQQARALGVKLKTEKDGRVTRYWAA